MNDEKKKLLIPKRIALVRRLAEDGFRVFTIQDAKNIAHEVNIDTKQVKEAIYYLKRTGWVDPIIRGVYSLSPLLLSGQPIHEYEIAMHLVKNSMISHLSAFHYHGLTDQIPRDVYLTTQTKTNIPGIKKGALVVRGVRYQIIREKKAHFFGAEKIWMHGAHISITDRERTLLDGLMRPNYCGGFSEVIHGFEIAQNTFDLSKVVQYACKLHASVANRLGWVLETIGVEDILLDKLQKAMVQGIVKLDANAKRSGRYNKRWQIQENI